jgi:hypothetical protein
MLEIKINMFKFII